MWYCECGSVDPETRGRRGTTESAGHCVKIEKGVEECMGERASNPQCLRSCLKKVEERRKVEGRGRWSIYSRKNLHCIQEKRGATIVTADGVELMVI